MSVCLCVTACLSKVHPKKHVTYILRKVKNTYTWLQVSIEAMIKAVRQGASPECFPIQLQIT